MDYEKKSKEELINEINNLKKEMGELKRNLKKTEELIINSKNFDDNKQKEMESKLYEIEELYRKLVATSTDAVVVIDKQGYIKYASPKSIEIYQNKSIDKIVGQNFLNWVLPEEHNRFNSYISSITANHNPRNHQYTLLKKNGSTFKAEINSALLYDKNGNIKGLLLVTKDITEKIKAEEKLQEYNEQLKTLAIELELQNKELQRLSITDNLTTLYNRRFIQDTLQNEFHKAKRYHSEFSILMIDADNFKSINDLYGHQFGDMILKELACIIKENSRKSDICGRYGGDEFIILVEISNDKSIIFAKKLLEKIRNHIFKYKEISIKTTVSIGIASFNNNMKDEEELIRYADKALYQVKESGRNNYSLVTYP